MMGKNQITTTVANQVVVRTLLIYLFVTSMIVIFLWIYSSNPVGVPFNICGEG